MTNTSRERIHHPSVPWERFPQMAPVDVTAFIPKSLVFWGFSSSTWKILGSSRDLIRSYTGSSIEADKVQSLIHRIDQKSREPMRRFRFWSVTRCNKLVCKSVEKLEKLLAQISVIPSLE